MTNIKNHFTAEEMNPQDFAVFAPLLSQIDRLLQTGPVTMAIEGGSAGGKTTLSRILESLYDTTVFHMDDFFLRPQQRSPQRFAQPGGNIDWERFLAEVLTPLKEHAPIEYKAFDCSTFTLKPPVVLTPSDLNIIEGAYSMHPQLAGYYDLSVFLDISPDLQARRIRKRNLPALAERYFNEWIPMEHLYFDKMDVRERCDLVINIG